jgi:hypothetical protein
MTDCFSLPDCFSACKPTQELPVTQLARHVNLFHLVISDNQRPESLSLPHSLAPPIKATTHFQPSHCTLNPKEWQSCSLVPINLSLPHVAWSLFGSTLQILWIKHGQSHSSQCTLLFSDTLWLCFVDLLKGDEIYWLRTEPNCLPLLIFLVVRSQYVTISSLCM